MATKKQIIRIIQVVVIIIIIIAYFLFRTSKVVDIEKDESSDKTEEVQKAPVKSPVVQNDTQVKSAGKPGNQLVEVASVPHTSIEEDTQTSSIDTQEDNDSQKVSDDISDVKKKAVSSEPIKSPVVELEHAENKYFNISYDADAWRLFSQDRTEDKTVGEIFLPDKSPNYFCYFKSLRHESTYLVIYVFPKDDIYNIETLQPDLANEYIRDLYFGCRFNSIKIRKVNDVRLIFSKIAYNKLPYLKYIFLEKGNYFFNFVLIGNGKTVNKFFYDSVLPGVI